MIIGIGCGIEVFGNRAERNLKIEVSSIWLTEKEKQNLLPALLSLLQLAMFRVQFLAVTVSEKNPLDKPGSRTVP